MVSSQLCSSLYQQHTAAQIQTGQLSLFCNWPSEGSAFSQQVNFRYRPV